MKKILIGLLLMSALFLQGQSWFSGTYAGKEITLNTGNGRYVYSTPTGSVFVSDFISAQPFDQNLATFAAATCGDYISVVSAKRQLTLKAGQTFLVHRLFVSRLFPLNGGTKTLLFSLDPSVSFEIEADYDDAVAEFAQCGFGVQEYIDSTWETRGHSYVRTNNIDSAIYRHGGIFIQNRDNIPGTSFQRDTVFMATADLNEGIGMYLSDINGSKDGQYIYFGKQNTSVDSLTTLIYHDSLGVFQIYQSALMEGIRSFEMDSLGITIRSGRDDKIRFKTNATYNALQLSDSTTQNIVDNLLGSNDTLLMAYAPGANEARWLSKAQSAALLDIPSLPAGYVAFGDGTGITGESDFVYDNTNNRLNLGAATGTGKLNFPDAGTTSADGIQFGTGLANLYRYTANQLVTEGSLIIGEKTSYTNGAGLAVRGNGGVGKVEVYRASDNVTGTYINQYKSRGTQLIPLALNTGDEVGLNQYYAYDGTSYNRIGYFGFTSYNSVTKKSNFTIIPSSDGTNGSFNLHHNATILSKPGPATGISDTSALSIVQQWNTTGSPTLIKANVTNTASGADANFLDFQVAGVSQFKVDKAGAVITTDVVRLTGYTVATLPTGTKGDTAYVNDATAPTFMATVVGGGAVVTPVFFDGTNWICH